MPTEWKAIYNDGSELCQYDSDGTIHKYGEIDRTRLLQFLLLVDKKPKIVVHLDKNKKLICRRRVAKQVFGLQKETVVYIVGWQENKNGQNIQMICFLFEDGHIELVDRFKEKHPWFYPIIFMPEEKLK